MTVPADPHHSIAGTPDAPPGRLRRAADTIAALMFALVFLIFNYKIITRYLEHDEAVWADEISVILFIWIIFWANAFLVRDKQQIVFDLAYRPLPDRWKRVFAIARALLIGGIFLWALPGSIDYLMFLWRERTPVLNLRLDLIYSCFALLMVTVIARAGYALVRLCGSRWRSAL